MTFTLGSCVLTTCPPVCAVKEVPPPHWALWAQRIWVTMNLKSDVISLHSRSHSHQRLRFSPQFKMPVSLQVFEDQCKKLELTAPWQLDHFLTCVASLSL